MKRYLQPCYL